MNSRVSIDPWRMDAISGSGVKHEILSRDVARSTAAIIPGFRFHEILPAAIWPSGINR
jgi:hypothetical protein